MSAVRLSGIGSSPRATVPPVQERDQRSRSQRAAGTQVIGPAAGGVRHLPTAPLQLQHDHGFEGAPGARWSRVDQPRIHDTLRTPRDPSAPGTRAGRAGGGPACGQQSAPGRRTTIVRHDRHLPGGVRDLHGDLYLRRSRPRPAARPCSAPVTAARTAGVSGAHRSGTPCAARTARVTSRSRDQSRPAPRGVRRSPSPMPADGRQRRRGQHPAPSRAWEARRSAVSRAIVYCKPFLGPSVRRVPRRRNSVSRR